MSTNIHLVRHGETDWNRKSIFRGTNNIPLNDLGRNQARLTRDSLCGKTFDAAYASPLSRAYETAEIILAPHSIKPMKHEGLLDIDYGEWTGKTKEEVMRQWPCALADWESRPNVIRPPGGNSLQEVFDQSFHALKKLTEQHKGESIILFSHRVVNKLLILATLGLGLERFPYIIQGNCCYNEIEYINHEFVIKSINNTSHITNTGLDMLKADF